MHEPKASALSAQDHTKLITPVMHKNLYIKLPGFGYPVPLSITRYSKSQQYTGTTIGHSFA